MMHTTSCQCHCVPSTSQYGEFKCWGQFCSCPRMPRILVTRRLAHAMRVHQKTGVMLFVKPPQVSSTNKAGGSYDQSSEQSLQMTGCMALIRTGPNRLFIRSIVQCAGVHYFIVVSLI